MGLLDKFENIEISNENAIPEKDLAYCQMMFEFYSKTYKTYENHLSVMVELEKEQTQFQEMSKEYVSYPDTFIWKYDGISCEETKKAMISLSKHFIGSVCHYFKNKYSITIDDKIVLGSSDRYEREPRFCELREILDKCVIGQLNGLSFIEKAIQEIKNKARIERHYSDWRKEWNYDVKGKTIKFRFGIDNIRPALYLYDNGEQEIIDCYTHNKIEDYKRFDNGNTDIKFYKSEYAMEFARKYLGYIS